MSSRIAGHLRSNIVGYVAVFIALSGTAYAVDGSLPGQDTVGSEDIINNDILSKDIADGRIFNVDLADNLITGQKMKDGTLTGADIEDDSVTGADVSAIGGGDVTNGSLGTADVADGTLGIYGADVANGSLTGQDVSNNSINADDVFGLRGDDDIADDSLTGADIVEGSLRVEIQEEGEPDPSACGTSDVGRLRIVKELFLPAPGGNIYVTDIFYCGYDGDYPQWIPMDD